MRIRFLKTLCIVGFLVASDTALMLGFEPANSAPKPFSAESNFMSEFGYACWSHYQKHGRWPKLTESEYLQAENWSNDPDLPSVIWAMHEMVKRNPAAKEYVVYWEINRWGTDWHDQYTGKWVYKPQVRKITKLIDNSPQVTLPLDDNLLTQLRNKWNELYNKTNAYKEWDSWWKSQI